MTKSALVLVISCTVMGSTSVAQVKPAPKVGLIHYMQNGHAGITRDLVAAAELMAEGDYGFKPTDMPEARTFAAVIAHTSAAMFDVCAKLRGVPNPAPDAGSKVASKGVVVQTLKEAVSFCTQAVDALNESSGGEFVRQGPVEAPKSAVLAGLLAHDAEMYGITTVYLRAKNIVPPASRP